jgi:hypothetical protein
MEILKRKFFYRQFDASPGLRQLHARTRFSVAASGTAPAANLETRSAAGDRSNQPTCFDEARRGVRSLGPSAEKA